MFERLYSYVVQQTSGNHIPSRVRCGALGVAAVHWRYGRMIFESLNKTAMDVADPDLGLADVLDVDILTGHRAIGM